MAKAKQFEVALKATGTIIVEAETAEEAAAKALDEFDNFEVEWTEEIEEEE